jgi:hypothetical protein
MRPQYIIGMVPERVQTSQNYHFGIMTRFPPLQNARMGRMLLAA